MAYLVGLPMTDIIIAYRAGRGGHLSWGDTIRTTPVLSYRTNASNLLVRLCVVTTFLTNSSSKLSACLKRKISIALLRK